MIFTLFQDTRAGKRPYNQDRLGHWQFGESLLLAVADGMGGHANGEIAAQIAIDHLRNAFQAGTGPRIANPELFLHDAVEGAHATIVNEARRMELREPPRTTIAACLVQQGRAWWSHVGDTRLYLIRNGRVEARTRDHSYVQQLIDAGKMREQAAENHPDRNRLFQCLGGTQTPCIGPAASAALENDDVLLLCSDGFWGPLTQRQILIGLIGREASAALPELIAQAEARGGPQCDNISVVAMQWHGMESAQSAARENLGRLG